MVRYIKIFMPQNMTHEMGNPGEMEHYAWYKRCCVTSKMLRTMENVAWYGTLRVAWKMWLRHKICCVTSNVLHIMEKVRLKNCWPTLKMKAYMTWKLLRSVKTCLARTSDLTLNRIDPTLTCFDPTLPDIGQTLTWHWFGIDLTNFRHWLDSIQHCLGLTQQWPDLSRY